jgi:predicted nucleic acid-binding protein
LIFVVDASVALKWFLRNEADLAADAVLERVLADPDSFAVPELFAYEVFSVLCRVHPHPELPFNEGFLPILHSGIFRHPMTEALSPRMFGFVAAGLTGYDAAYAALAEELGGLWLTFDSKAHRCLESHGISWDLGKGLPAALAS